MRIERDARVFVAGHCGLTRSRLSCKRLTGTPVRCSTSRLRSHSWSPTYNFDAGIRSIYDWFLAEQAADSELCGMASEPETV